MFDDGPLDGGVAGGRETAVDVQFALAERDGSPAAFRVGVEYHVFQVDDRGSIGVAVDVRDGVVAGGENPREVEFETDSRLLGEPVERGFALDRDEFVVVVVVEQSDASVVALRGQVVQPVCGLVDPKP